MINPGPTQAVKNKDASSSGFTRIDWTYKDDGNTYQTQSFKLDASKNIKGDEDFYSAFVYLNGKRVTTFAGGRMARNLYDKAAAVMLIPSMKAKITARAKSR